MLNLITKNTIRTHQPFILKWNDNPGDTGSLNPAWAEATTPDSFLDKAAAATTILDASHVIDMKTLEYDLKYLEVKVDLEYQRASAALNTTTQTYTDGRPTRTFEDGQSIPSNRETIPEFKDNRLRAEPFIARTPTSVNFLEENIEGKNFLTKIESKLAAATGVSFESIGIYGTKGELAPAEIANKATGYGAIDGFIKKLEIIKASSENDYVGVSDVTIDPNESILDDLKDIILQYVLQGGAIGNSVFYVPTLVEFTARSAISARQTPLGDASITTNGQVVIQGVPLEVAPVLDTPRNGYSAHSILTDKNNLAFGIMRNITSEQEYSAINQEYNSIVTCKGDVGFVWKYKTIAAPVAPYSIGGGDQSPSGE
ncbi:MAG: hypothetical protein LBM96_00715 [Methanobrevibacter sp.]|jgi:hypothetical protein|nr:hypothetical protein [Candidatus Methanoflexus mossambicus]